MPLFKKNNTDDACRFLPDLNPEESARYRRYRALLDHHRTALNLMADLEQTYYNNRPFTIQSVERDCHLLINEADGLIHSLADLSGKNYEPLFAVLGSIRRSTNDELAPDFQPSTEALTLSLDNMEARQARDAGAKAANLARVRGELLLPTPDGFVITTEAYRLFLTETGLALEIDEFLAEAPQDDPGALKSISKKIRTRIMESFLPGALLKAMTEASENLAGERSSTLRLAVRSSAVGEDGEISFAGQYRSVLNVAVPDLAEAYKQVAASKYSASALSYRMHHGVDDRETPMAVLVLEMIHSSKSGVLYTADPVGKDESAIRVSAVDGLGDVLVGGQTSPARIYRIDKGEFRVREMTGQGEDAPSFLEGSPPGVFLHQLWEAALRLEKHFKRPLDIEWAVDEQNRLFLLQVRPLLVVEKTLDEGPEPLPDYPGHPRIIEGGKCAASGLVAGRVLVLNHAETDDPVERLEPDTILVARTASTSITPWMGKVKGIITDIGGVASHLASVAREFGVPALFDTRNATSILKDGQEITLWASRGTVYSGVVDELVRGMTPVKRPIFASPVHLRVQRLLDYISPLNLTAPESPQFTPEGCLTIHDIIRFCHEMSMREMFHFGETMGRLGNAVQIKSAIPLHLFAMDLGGGLKHGLTDCDDINAHDIVSKPFRALWTGLTHPGVNWSRAVDLGAHHFMSLMLGGALPGQSRLGGASHALVSDDYMNLSLRFGYHFATIDALCGLETEHNYVSLQFTGGAGTYYGRSLRVQYLANVLSRLGFETTPKGDFIEAFMARADQAVLLDSLDQLGRLLGSSRLLDMAMQSAEQVRQLTEDFFQGKYDGLEPERKDAPDGFHLITGNWKKSKPDMEPGILQDGSDFGSWITVGVSRTLMRVMGKRYQEFLDNMEAYYYFPLAIAKESSMNKGDARVSVKPLSGVIDQAGGLAFAIRDWNNYFVFRINALENNAILFEFKNGRRLERKGVSTFVASEQWRRLRIATAGRVIRAFLEGSLIIEYTADRDLEGYIGLWTKADSVTLFKDFAVFPLAIIP